MFVIKSLSFGWLAHWVCCVRVQTHLWAPAETHFFTDTHKKHSQAMMRNNETTEVFFKKHPWKYILSLCWLKNKLFGVVTVPTVHSTLLALLKEKKLIMQVGFYDTASCPTSTGLQGAPQEVGHWPPEFMNSMRNLPSQGQKVMCYSWQFSGNNVWLMYGPHNHASIHRNSKSITFSNGLVNGRVFQLNFPHQYSAK